MNYLYINAIVNETYKNLNCASPFPQTHLNRIVNLSINDGVLTSNVPGIMTFFSVKEADEPILVMSRVLRHRLTESVGRMIQSLGWAWGKDVMTRNLDSIFDTAFYSEEEVLAMGQNGTVVPLPRDKQSTPIDPLPELSQSVKAALLNGLFRRWLLKEPAMRVAVPKTADYNAYVISAVKAIYRILPVGLRAEVGFCSYTPDPGSIMSRVYIGFIPEAIADSHTLFLDGSNQAALNAYSSAGDKALDTLVTYLSTLPDEQLQNFLMKIYQEVEGDGNAQVMCDLNAKSYAPIGNALQIITSSATAMEQMATWSEFLRNADAYSPTLQEAIRGVIRNKATTEVLCEHLRKFCAERNTAAEIFQALCAYEVFVANNAEVGAPLWNAALALCKEKKCTAVAMDGAATAILDKLAVFADKAQLDALFLEARREDFVALQTMSTEDIAAVQARLADANRLLDKIAERKAAGAEALEAEIRAYQAALGSQNSDLVVQGFKSRLDDLGKRYQAKAITTAEARDGVGQLWKEVNEHPEAAALAELAERIKKAYSDLIVNYCQEETDKLTGKYPTRMSEIRQRIADIDTLLVYMRKYAKVVDLQQFIDKCAKAKEELRKKADASNTKLSAFYETISGNISYFAVLEALTKTDLSALDAEDHKDLEKTLKERRPKNYRDYSVSFRHHYNKPLSLQAICGQHEFICKRILQDLCAFDAVTTTFEKGTDIQEFLKELDHLKYLAKYVAGRTGVAVVVEQHTVSADRFVSLLAVGQKGKLDVDEDSMEDVLCTLMDYGVYKGNAKAMDAIFDLFQKNGWQMANFAFGVIKGAFGLGNAKVYTALFEKMMKAIKQNGVTRFADKVMEMIELEGDTEREARRTFKKVAGVYRQREEKKESKKKEKESRKGKSSKKSPFKSRGPLFWIIVGLVVAAVAAGIVLLCIVLFGEKEAGNPSDAQPSTTSTTTTVSTDSTDATSSTDSTDGDTSNDATGENDPTGSTDDNASADPTGDNGLSDPTAAPTESTTTTTTTTSTTTTTTTTSATTTTTTSATPSNGSEGGTDQQNNSAN